MNSIESYSPPKATSNDEDSSTLTDALGSDAADLEALRALMCPPATQPPAFGVSITEDKANATQSPLKISNTASAADTVRKALEEAFTTNSRNATQVHVDRLDIPAVAEQPISDFANLGHSILHSMDSQSAAAAAAAAQVSGPATADRIEQVNSLMNEMADRLLVTDPLHGQNAEVRIKIAENIMPGTEVRMWREDGGQLRVEFDTTNAYWARVLNDSTTQLSQRLSERLNLPEGAQVTVQHESGQPQDGRSRNRHTPWEQEQEQANA